MKKIYSLAILAAACLGMASCSDDKGEATQLSTIKVLSAETSFESLADTGKVVLDCNPVKAYVGKDDQDWLDVQIDQNTVNLYAKLNGSSESRNALLTIKKSENDSIQLNVDQKGLVFIVESKSDIVLYDDESHEYTYKVQSAVAGKILSAPSWVTANMTKEQIDVKISANNDGHMRQGYVKYNCGSIVDSIKVSQYDFDKDLKGNYLLLTEYDAEKNVYRGYLPVTMGESTMSLEFDYNGQTIKAGFNTSFDRDNVAFSISSGQVIASFQKRNQWTYFHGIFATAGNATLNRQDSNGNLIFGDESGLITAPMVYDDVRGTYGFFTGDAYNSGGYQGTFAKILIGAFTNSIPYQATLVDGSVWSIEGPLVLVKYDSPAAAQALKTAKPLSFGK